MRTFLLEGCIDSVASAAAAARGGADRLEVCADLPVGGTTVRPSVFRQIREQVQIPLRVLIRPRFGDFLFDEMQIREMEEDIRTLKDLGADGVVIGALRPDGTLDTKVLKRLILAAGGLPVTLHRAFDMTRDPMEALETAIGLGIDTILTSGQRDVCIDGIELLKALHEQADGRIHIMCGSGVKAENIESLAHATGIRSFHMSGSKTRESGMIYRNPNVHMGLKNLSEYEIRESDEEQFRQAATVLSKLYG
ncbi:MAG: copper homeostasis protein CutC [Clostridiales bacterium]|nr:copper homeostasis protein CutC [Clostridiales bacterium]